MMKNRRIVLQKLVWDIVFGNVLRAGLAKLQQAPHLNSLGVRFTAHLGKVSDELCESL